MLERCCFRYSFANPVPCLKAISVGCGIPWDICYDDFSVVPVGGVVGHPEEGLKAFPWPALPFGSQRFLILVQPELAMAHPPLRPHTPGGDRSC
jgi:hypothetical protein